MATAGSLLTDFVSQNSIILIAAVLVTAAVVALSTYYIARSYMSSTTDHTVAVSDTTREETAQDSAATDRSSASNSKATDESGKRDENGVGGNAFLLLLFCRGCLTVDLKTFLARPQ